MSDIRFHSMPDGPETHRRIAFRTVAGAGPALVFLPGYMSDMDGGKATALFEWAKANGRAAMLLDYSGCGHSPGDFADGSLSRWREEVVALVEAELEGPVVLVGSSMGGWLMVLCALALGEKVVGLVGIAAAPDFTDWGYNTAEKARLAEGETIFQPNDYGYDPAPTHALFWQDGEANRVLDAEIAIDCSVRLLHGLVDKDVPWQTSLRLAERLRSDDVQLILVKDGDHRLSREGDIALLLRTVATFSQAKSP